MQLALNVQIPHVLSGNGGEAVYIDTEGSFLVERLAEMAHEISTHLKRMSTEQMSQISSTQSSVASNPLVIPTTDLLLERVHVFRAHDQSGTWC
jgi:RAD51-like protein 2